VTRIRRFLGAVLIAGSSTQCLLFTEPPNVQPEVTLGEPTPGPEIRKKTEAKFTATVTDDQGPESVRLQWFLREGNCPASLIEAQTEPLVATGNSHEMMREMEGAFCVGVIATDKQGASDFDARRYEVVNRRPIARIAMLEPSSGMPGGTSVAKPVPLYSNVRLTGAMSEDDDPPNLLRFRWKVTPPAGAAEPAPCTTNTAVTDGPELCRRLNTAGEYKFELVVGDGQSESEEPASLPVTAGADSKPCFERTEPPHDLARGGDGLPPVVLASPDRPYTFRVLEVRDDGDSYPTPTGVIAGSFSWKWRAHGATEFDRLTDPSLTSFTIEANRYRPGDEVEVRVDYRDRQPLEAYPCLKNNDADRCESPSQSSDEVPCFQRVSWRLRFIP
jgi:hypothetical protein